MKTNLPEIFRKARARAVPIIGIETADPAATVKTCIASLNGKGDTTPVCIWDICRGLIGANDCGKAHCQSIEAEPINTGNPVECLQKLANSETPKGTIIFFSNAQRYVNDAPTAQGIWNLRDLYAATPATLVLLAPALTLPAELARDVVILSEPLPTREELSAELDSMVQDTKANNPSFPDVTEEARPRILTRMTGLSSFEAKQALALSMNKTGIDEEELLARKIRQIEQTPGLTVYQGKETFDDIGGLANAKEQIGRTIAGKLDVSCIVFLDELDKSMSAATSDSSGTTQDQNKVLLTYMQDNKRQGALFLGPPGTGKTILAKTAGNQYKKPVIFFDLGGMKSKFVGDSEQLMRQALKVIHAVSDGKAFFIGACNRSENLPPELRRRFNYLSMFFNLPDEEERASALAVWTAKHGLTTAQCDWTAPDGWTGAEIENAALKAWAMDCTLSEAARTIVPIAKSAAETVEALRKSASNKYISASKPGLYTYTTPGQQQARTIQL